MALVTSAQYPGLRGRDIGEAFGQGLAAFRGVQDIKARKQQLALGQRQLSQIEEEEARKQKARDIKADLLEAEGASPHLSQLARVDDAAFDNFFKQRGVMDQASRDDLANFAFQVRRLPYDQQTALLEQKAAQMQAQGQNPGIIGEMLPLDPEGRASAFSFLELSALSPKDRAALSVGGKEGLASAKTEILSTGAVIQSLPDGSVDVRNPGGDVVTGQERLRILEEAWSEKERRKREESELTVETAKRVSAVESREKRVSTTRDELSESRRLAARSDIKLRQAEKLIGMADQGITGAGKVQLARLFPSIDASDEGALASSFRSLALDELQKFKGPTTDYEFGVTESIVGALGDPKTANLARIKSLQRNNYFVKKEAEQFNKFIREGGEPEDFSFNFEEKVNTKKGVFSLQQLQDTAVENHLSIEDVLKRLNQ